MKANKDDRKKGIFLKNFSIIFSKKMKLYFVNPAKLNFTASPI